MLEQGLNCKFLCDKDWMIN